MERPIIFRDNMVRAILDGRKTQTRRVIKDVPPQVWTIAEGPILGENIFSGQLIGVTRNAQGLWWTYENAAKERKQCYLAKCPYGQPGDRLWVPKKASRILLEITDVRVERDPWVWVLTFKKLNETTSS